MLNEKTTVDAILSAEKTIAEQTADALGRTLDDCMLIMDACEQVLVTAADMDLTHAQRNTINTLLVTMLKRRDANYRTYDEIPF